MSDTDLAQTTRDYLDALKARDLEKCLQFFDDEATLNWQGGVYKGIKAIEDWHKDRFDAELRIIEVEDIQVQGSEVIIDTLVTSNRLQAWRLKSLAGRVTIRFDGTRISDVRFKVRVTNPFEQWG